MLKCYFFMFNYRGHFETYEEHEYEFNEEIKHGELFGSIDIGCSST